MDFTNRDTQSSAGASASAATGSPKKRRDRNKWGRLSIGILVTAILALLVALVVLIGFSGDNNEDKYVDTSKLQVVSLNNGQAYFGHVRSLNSKYLVLTDIYYLQTTNAANASSSASSANSNLELRKLGCEIHQPYDQMVINTDQVTFWENLQPNGKVAQAVSTFEKDNPNGLKCTDQGTSQSSTSSTSNTQSATPSPTTNTSQSSH